MYICLFIFFLSCSVANQDKSHHYSYKEYSKGFKYGFIYKNTFPVQDSLRVDEFIIYKLDENIRQRRLRSEEIEDSLLGDGPHVTPDSLQDVVDLDEEGKTIRNFRITYHQSDVFYDSLFTEQDFSWNLEDSTLHFSGTGLTIKLE